MRVRSPLALKVFAGVFGTAVLLVVAMTLASVWRVDRSFARYVQRLELDRLQGLVEQLQRDRQAFGDWRFVPDDPEEYRRWFNAAMGFGAAAAPGRGPPPQGGPPGDDAGPPQGGGALPGRERPPPERRGPPDRLALARRVAVFDASGQRIGGAALAMAQTATVPIVVAGATEGYVGLLPQVGPVEAGAQLFLREQWRDAALVGMAALLLSAAVAAAFARHLRRPVGQLVQGTRALAEGDLSMRLATDRSDEFGLIAGQFNRMAAQLEQQERSRREWIASTSHELRTPLTVLRALIEALQEGIRQGDAATLQRLHEQVMSLSRLVDDLHLLAQHDTRQAQVARQALHPRLLIDGVLDAQRQRLAQAGITATVIDHSANATIMADPQRLTQLFHNLVENALRYTDAPGRLQITLSMTGSARAVRQWRAEFDDSAPGVAAGALPRLFERFYRGEASRSRATGGSGLGLAICRAIVEDHQGRIEAQPSPLGGLRVTVTLPA